MRNPALLSRLSRCDAVGMTASGFCLVHCIFSPLVFVFFPAAEAFVPGDDVTHHTLGIVVLAVGAIAFRKGYNVHMNKFIPSIFCLGMIAIVFGSFGHHLFKVEWVATLLTISGSVLLLIAHALNRTFCRLCERCNHP